MILVNMRGGGYRVEPGVVERRSTKKPPMSIEYSDMPHGMYRDV
jgi:hypothetical protein